MYHMKCSTCPFVQVPSRPFCLLSKLVKMAVQSHTASNILTTVQRKEGTYRHRICNEYRSDCGTRSRISCFHGTPHFNCVRGRILWGVKVPARHGIGYV